MHMLKLAIATLLGTAALAATPSPASAQNFAPHRDARVTCASHHGRYNACRLPYRGHVRLVHQMSNGRCVRGRTWGQRGDTRVWVSRGCRAEFAVRSRDRRYLDNHVGSRNFVRDRDYAVSCRSYGSRTTCSWDSRYGNPYLMQRVSGSCVEGRDWGYTRDGRIWVDANCNARFGYHYQ
jgi:hypothetical protein